MSLTKRIWLDRDPAYEDVRQEAARETAVYLAEFTHRIALRRRNRQAGGGYWDVFWRSAVHRAAEQLNLEGVSINDGFLLRKAEEKSAVTALAETLCEERWAGLHR